MTQPLKTAMASKLVPIICLTASLALVEVSTWSQTPGHNAPHPGSATMNDEQHKIVELITLGDDEYFSYEKEQNRALQTKVAEALNPAPLSKPPTHAETGGQDKLPLIAISAPKIVDLNRRDDLPILLANHQTGLRRWQVSDSQNLQVVLQDLDSGRVTTSRLEVTAGKRMMTPDPSGTGLKPDDINARSTLTSVRRYSLRNLLDIGWHPSRFALTVLLYDTASNTVQVELKTGGETDDEKTVMRPKPIQPSPFLDANPVAIPEVNGQTGIVMSIPGHANGRIPVQATIKAPLQTVATAPSAGGKVLLASLLLVKLDDEHPTQIDLSVPTKLQAIPGLGLSVEASFSFDALAALAGQIGPGTYQAYLVAGTWIAGPYPLDFKP